MKRRLGGMQRALVKAVLLAVPLLGAVGAAGVEAESESTVASARNEEFTEEKCAIVVKKVEEEGKYTEESVLPICNEEMRSPKCDFFAEALSLASSHSDFSAEKFCKNIAEARFCSETMDELLSSLPVADMAYGHCMRKKEKKGVAYCSKFQKMLAYAIQNDDLDTMRACYMIETYTNLETVPDKGEQREQTKDSPKMRIISSSSKEINDFGTGKAVVTTPPPPEVPKGIVVRPHPLDDFGDGKGKGKVPVTPAPAPAPAAAKQEETPAGAKQEEAPRIIVAPVPADKEASKEGAASALSITIRTAPTGGKNEPTSAALDAASKSSGAESGMSIIIQTEGKSTEVHIPTPKAEKRISSLASPVKPAGLLATVNVAAANASHGISLSANPSREMKAKLAPAGPSQVMPEVATKVAPASKPPSQANAPKSLPVISKTEPESRFAAKVPPMTKAVFTANPTSKAMVTSRAATVSKPSNPAKRANAGLAQSKLGSVVKAVDRAVSAKGKKDDYGGFLSKFVS